MLLPLLSRRSLSLVEGDRAVREAMLLMAADEYEIHLAALVSTPLTRLRAPDMAPIVDVTLVYAICRTVARRMF
jgi:hypothetical protein